MRIQQRPVMYDCVPNVVSPQLRLFLRPDFKQSILAGGIVFLLAFWVTAVVYHTGGTKTAYPQLAYLPIMLAAPIFGWRGEGPWQRYRFQSRSVPSLQHNRPLATELKRLSNCSQSPAQMAIKSPVRGHGHNRNIHGNSPIEPFLLCACHSTLLL